MNRTLYYDLVIWLNEREVREDADDWTKNILATAGRQYETQGTILYRKCCDTLVPVIREGKTTDILHLAHNNPLAGHMGQYNTYQRLKGNAWWPGIQDDIVTYVRNCEVCQKRARAKEVSEPSSATIRAEPFSHIGIDVMGPLPITLTDKRYIILAIDFFTKYTEAAAVQEADSTLILFADMAYPRRLPATVERNS